MSGARSFPCRSGGLLFAAGSDRENDFPFLYRFLYRRTGLQTMSVYDSLYPTGLEASQNRRKAPWKNAMKYY